MYLKISNDIFGHKILSSKEKLQIYKFSNLNIFYIFIQSPSSSGNQYTVY